MSEEAGERRDLYIYGPPGTGKTHNAASRIAATVRARGPENVMVMSFTRTAAREIASRDVNLPDSQVGTVHAQAWRALGRPTIAQADLKDWNARHPSLAMKPSASSGLVEEAPAEWSGASDAEKALGEIDILRARMVPPEVWPHSLRGFWEKWSEWLADGDRVDFTMMVERALAEVDEAPGRPEVLVADEAQDQTPLEHALLRKWGEHCDVTVTYSDDDQCQPGWTQVETARHGWVAMQDLDPTVHRLLSYDFGADRIWSPEDGRLDGVGGEGHAFEVASRPYTGTLIVVHLTGRAATMCTPDHRWPTYAGWVRADDLDPERHRLMLADAASLNAAGEWCSFETFAIEGSFPVYSINVEPHHNYIVDGGIVTGNCIYRFRGSEPSSLIGVARSPEDKIVLSQSYRVPAKILVAAERWVGALTQREPKEYAPRGIPEGAPEWVTEGGRVSVADFSIDAGDDLVKAARPHIEAGKTVLILAGCGYQLDPVKTALRRAGVPYHNPWRVTRGDWNPLGNSTSKRTAAKDRLLAYLVMDEAAFGDRARLWTGGDVKAWSHFVKSQGVFRRGAKGAIAGLPDRELDYDEVAQLFVNEEALEAAVEPSLAWFRENLTAEGRRALEFPLEVVKGSGAEALERPPQVIIGTVHSAKGGQADVVYLCPDLSMAGQREWDAGGEPRDSVIRQFYVGMTRAFEELVILQPNPSQSLYAPIGEVVP